MKGGIERRTCLLLAAIYPTRPERVLSWLTGVAYRRRLTYPVGHVADRWRAGMQRRRALRSFATGRPLTPRNQSTRKGLL